MKLPAKTRSYSKGLIDTKDKIDAIPVHKELQQFSPNTTQTKYFVKDSNSGNANPETQMKLSQIGFTSGITQTHFQKYNSNLISTSVNKSNNYGVNSSNASSQFTASVINFSSQIMNNPQQLKKQDSLKNISKANKKGKEPSLNLVTPPLIKLEVSPLKKLDSLVKKKPIIINPNINTSKASISLAGSGAVNSNNASTRINQAVSVGGQEIPSNQLHLESSNLINVKLSQEALKLRRNEDNIFSNLGSKLNSLPSSEFISPDKYRMQATQDTRDSTSNSSSVKMHKHSNSNNVHSDYTLKSSIKNPEDLHFFYVSTIQINKDFIYKFDHEDNN